MRLAPCLLALLVPACAVEAGTDGDSARGADAISDAQTEGGQAIARLVRDAVRTKGAIDPVTATRLTAFLKGTQQDDAKRLLQSVLADSTVQLTPPARAILTDALSGKIQGDVPLSNAVYRVELGSQSAFVFDDQLYLTGTGVLRSATGITGHSRGYAKKADGVLRSAHGSLMPPHASAPASVAEAPPAALDGAARTFGLKLPYGFAAMAQSNYNPNAQYWEGLCHAWSWSSLDERINVLVDTSGDVGKRGVWIFGHWISRADLGNWMMGVSNALSIADAVLVDSFVKPDALVKGVAEYVMTGRRGLRADIWNDAEQGHSEVWNQPIVSADLSVESLPSAARDAVLTYARADASAKLKAPVADARLVRLHANWGSEVSDANEGPVSLGDLTWNMYLVTESNGRVAASYMAHHLAAKVAGLPETQSDALPDYFAYPKHELIDAALAGKASTLLDNAQDGPAFRFFVGTVLGRGIPDDTRAAFEREALGSAPPNVASLRARFPGIANAYSPEQWKSGFEPRLGSGTTFGAVWGQASSEFPKAYLAPR